MEINVLVPSEVSQEFIQGMVNRMMVSYHKYGKVMFMHKGSKAFRATDSNESSTVVL